MADSDGWHLYTAEGSQGPYSFDDLKSWLEAGSISPEWQVWREGMSDWAAIGSLPEFRDTAAEPKRPVKPIEKRSEAPRNQPGAVAAPVVAASGRSERLRQILPLVVLLVLAAAGWYAYSTHFSAPEAAEETTFAPRAERTEVASIEEPAADPGAAVAEHLPAAPPFPPAPPPAPGKNLEATVMDVWQGDGALLKLPSGEFVLIDAGPSDRGSVMPYLRRRGVTRLKALVMSHPHADHIGGVLSVLRAIKVETVYDCGAKHPGALYETILKQIEKSGAKYVQPRSGDLLAWDPNLRVAVLHPDHSDYENINNSSIVLQITYGTISFLFTGDAEHEAEERLVKAYGDRLRSHFLKVGHHGSRTSTNPAMLEAVSPNIAAISCGAGNRYGHPTAVRLTALDEIGAKVHRTDREGYVTVGTDGTKIWSSTEKTPFPAAQAPRGDVIAFTDKGWAKVEGADARAGAEIEGSEALMTSTGERVVLRRAFRAAGPWDVSMEISSWKKAGEKSLGQVGIQIFSVPSAGSKKGSAGAAVTFSIHDRYRLMLSGTLGRGVLNELADFEADRIAVKRRAGQLEFLGHAADEDAWRVIWSLPLEELAFSSGEENFGILIFTQAQQGEVTAGVKDFRLSRGV